MTSAKKKENPNVFTHLSRLLARLLGVGHLPAPGQRCDRCQQRGHLECWQTDGPDIEHLFVELDSIERRAA